MDIGSGNGWPAAALSNFSPHPFTFRGFEIASMGGFLQGPNIGRHSSEYQLLLDEAFEAYLLRTSPPGELCLLPGWQP